MKRFLIIIIFSFMLAWGLNSQDTIVVQTLTFDSITTRRGIWEFPNEGTFRKILMHHTLKCDAQTQHDQYPCGEWDYLTYNKVFVHTGTYDSTLYYHPSFTLANNNAVDSILVSNSIVYNYFNHVHTHINYLDTITYEFIEVGSGTENTNAVFPGPNYSGRSQYLWKAEELSENGFTAGLITGIGMNVSDAQNTNHVMVRMGMTDAEEITPNNIIHDLDTVFYNEVDFSMGDWVDLDFYQAFNWDGISNIVIDFSYTDPNLTSENIFMGGDPGFDCGVSIGSNDYALDLDGRSDFLSLPEDTYFNSNFTFEVWFYKRNNNNWSRIFDFGNGPNQSNVLMALSKGTSGKLSFHVNNESQNRSFEFDDPSPENEWVHVAVTLTNPLSWVYVNGEQISMELLQIPDDITRTINYIGRSNWSNDAMADVIIDEFRLYNTALDAEQIAGHYNQPIENPELDPNLLVYFDFNEEEEGIFDLSSYSHHPLSYGMPSKYAITGPEKFLGFQQTNIRPWIRIERLVSSQSNIVYENSIDSIADSPTQLVLYENLSNPTVATDTILIYEAGNRWVYENWKVIDSVWVEPDDIMYKEDLPYYGEPFEILEEYEIGRFITPYGIGLDLGPQGFTWTYDVTDYVNLLKGSVDLSAGNQQELIDLRFEFIEGTPPRNVLQIDRIWGRYSSKKYSDLDNDEVLSAITLPLLYDAEEFKIKTRLTGHGHNSNTGEYPHCCEWKDNEHYFMVNGDTIADWHIFQYHDCGLNPVYPQGGTWPGAREGWCPGDLVMDNEFEISEYVNGNEVTLDYGITPVPPDNLGMGNGNYIVGMHLVQYEASHFANDAEIYDVVTPASTDYYSRKNPVCYDPEIIIRNNGTSPLTSLDFEYKVSGGTSETYTWYGSLPPHVKDTITLPVPSEFFWLGDTLHEFHVTISNPNGAEDEYSENNLYKSKIVLPDMYDDPFILRLKTNNQGYRYHLQVRDILGNILLEWSDLGNNEIYEDTLNFNNGCYTIELIDDEDMGLSYWAYPEQGSGYLKIIGLDSSHLKTFGSDFGRSIFYPFNLGAVSYIQDPGSIGSLNVYPNPADEMIYIELNEKYKNANIIIYNNHGQIVRFETWNSNNGKAQLSLDDIPPGLYIIRVEGSERSLHKKIIKK